MWITPLLPGFASPICRPRTFLAGTGKPGERGCDGGTWCVSKDLSCALETLCLSLQVWDSKHRRSYLHVAEVDSQSMLSNAFLGALAAACTEVTWGAR